MKVITKIVIDYSQDDRGKVIEEHSYDYDGPLAKCDFGGSAPSSDSHAADAAREAARMNLFMYNTSRIDMGPYREAGERALPYYGGIMGIPGYDKVDPTNALRETPGYNWMLDQGIGAIDRSAAARGMLGSGAEAKGLMKYGQGMADQSYNNYMNRLYNMIGTGQNAAAQTGQFGAQAAGAAGNALVAGGQAQDQADWRAYQSGNSGWNSLAGGLGLLGGLALSPMPAGGFGKTMLGSALNYMRN